MEKSANKEIHHYTPGQTSQGHFFQVWWQVIYNVFRYRDLVWQLTRVDLLGQLKRSMLGVAWLFINPIVVVLVWLFLNKAGVFNPGETDIPYPAYVLLSTSLWNFFEGLFENISKSITTAGPMFIQAKFPHEVVVAQKMLVHLINFSIPFALNIGVLLAFGVEFSWGSLLFPLALIPLFLFAASLGLIFSVVEVVAVDIYNGFQRLLHYLIYATPVVYSDKISSPLIQSIIQYNPITYLLGGARDVLLKGTLTDPSSFYIWSGFTVLFFLIVVRVFVAAEQKVIERITA